jgi:hypothetical protein
MNPTFTPIGLGTNTFDLEKYRAELQRIFEEELMKEGKTLAFLCSKRQNFGHPPKPQWAAQLKECRAEWRRRHPRVGAPTTL